MKTAKIQVQEKIPAEFAESMEKVCALIAAGDESTTIESDDLLQIDRVCGGLHSAVEQSFGFCFVFLEDDGEAKEDEGGTIEWHFYLRKDQIDAIAKGTLRELNMWRCAGHDCGRRWDMPDGYCPRCDFA